MFTAKFQVDMRAKDDEKELTIEEINKSLFVLEKAVILSY